MSSPTLVKETLTVQGVNAKPKYGAGGVLVERAGKEEWLNFNDNVNVSISDIEKGGTYTFAIEFKETKTGLKGFIHEVVSLDQPGNGEKKTNIVGSFSSTTPIRSKFVDNSSSMKMGGLFHDAAAITQGLVSGGGLNAKDALSVFSDIVDGVITKRDSLDK